MKLIKRIVHIRFLLVVCWAMAAAGVAAKGIVALPEVPEEVPMGRPRANYIIEHYWDKMPWKTAHTMPRKMETSLRDFAQLLPLAAPDTVFLSVDKLLKGASKKPELMRALMPMAEATFHSDTALLLSDDVYLPFAQAAAKFKKLDAAERERYGRQAGVIASSARGRTLPAIMVTGRNGKEFALNDTVAGAQTYVYIIETPESGRLERVRFAANVAARQLVAAGLLKPVLLYGGEATEDWWKSTEGLPREWSVGQMPNAAEHFDLRNTPAIYLTDKEMTVVSKWMPMSALITNCEQLIQALQKELEQK